MSDTSGNQEEQDRFAELREEAEDRQDFLLLLVEAFGRECERSEGEVDPSFFLAELHTMSELEFFMRQSMMDQVFKVAI